MLDAYIFDGKRTPFGRYAGTLAKVRPDDLLASAINSVMAEQQVQSRANRGHRRRLRQSGWRRRALRCAPCGIVGRTADRDSGHRSAAQLRERPGRNCARCPFDYGRRGRSVPRRRHRKHEPRAFRLREERKSFLARPQDLRQHDRPALLESEIDQALRRRPDAADRRQPRQANSTSSAKKPTNSRSRRSRNTRSPKAKAFSPGNLAGRNARRRAKARCRRSPKTSIRVRDTDWNAGQDEAAIRRRRHDRGQRVRRQRRRGAMLIGSRSAGEKAGMKPIARVIATPRAASRRASWASARSPLRKGARARRA